VTVIKDGYHGDCSKMFGLGKVGILEQRLMRISHECMVKGIEMVRPGVTLGDIGHVIQSHAEKNGFSIVREYCGHGIGKEFHESPQVLHYGTPGTGNILEEGMTFTIEPMVNAGRKETRILADGWTVVTRDHKASAQWEHTILVTKDGFEALTCLPGDEL
jgi:methionyl aminopeptidase